MGISLAPPVEENAGLYGLYDEACGAVQRSCDRKAPIAARVRCGTTEGCCGRKILTSCHGRNIPDELLPCDELPPLLDEDEEDGPAHAVPASNKATTVVAVNLFKLMS